MNKRVTLHDRKPLTKAQRVKLFFERDGECCICKGKIAVGEKWIDEHIKPLAMGGGNEWENRGCAHIPCAKGKTKTDIGQISKAKRVEAKHIGAHQPKAQIQSAPFKSRLKSDDKFTRIAAGHKAHLDKMELKGGAA